VSREALKLRGALARALMMAGALERALELSVQYAQQRVQFGRKIGQFQAIQQELARFGGETAIAVAAALSAAGVMERGGDGLLAVASAKIRAADAAREGSDRAPGARRDWRHQRVRAASRHAAAVGMAGRIR
jgi:alkylation response protein AidB-like acyl-CoA dehydrogenase